MKYFNHISIDMEKYIIVDVDGTIANVQKRFDYAAERAEFKSPQWWDIFLDGKLYKLDSPIDKSIERLHYLTNLGYGILYLSGRRDDTLNEFRDWIWMNAFPWQQIHQLEPPILSFLRPRGMDTAAFKLDRMEKLSTLFELTGGITDSETDVKLYEYIGIKNILKVLSGKIWESDDYKEFYQKLKNEIGFKD